LRLQSEGDQFVSEKNLRLPLNPFAGCLAVRLGFGLLRSLGLLHQPQFDFANGLKVFVQLVPVERADFSVEGLRIGQHHVEDALLLIKPGLPCPPAFSSLLAKTRESYR